MQGYPLFGSFLPTFIHINPSAVTLAHASTNVKHLLPRPRNLDLTFDYQQIIPNTKKNPPGRAGSRISSKVSWTLWPGRSPDKGPSLIDKPGPSAVEAPASAQPKPIADGR